MGSPLKIGIIGVGKISEQYFASFPGLPGLELVAVADLDEDRAARIAAEQGVESLSVDALLDDPRIDAVLNLTIPAAHVDIATRALAAGKHVFVEKPLALHPRRPSACSKPPARAAFGWDRRRTPCSAPASRPRATCSTPG